MSSALETRLGWASRGTALVERALGELGEADAAYDAPSLLPDWTRKHLLAHVAANADALVNLTHWARTGEETPMYSSPEQRNADIEAGGRQPAAELRAWFDRSAEVLEGAWATLTPEQWDAPVVTAQGRTVPASETPWMRAREVMVHAVDLGAGVTFADLPADFCAALIDDIAAKRSGSGNGPALEIAPTDVEQRWSISGTGEPVVVTGALCQLTAYLAGRGYDNLTTKDGSAVPVLPAWL